MKSLPTTLLFISLSCLPACTLPDMYDQDYVFYDSTKDAEEAEAAKEAEQDPEPQLTSPRTETPAEAGTQPIVPTGDLNRLFQLEAVLDEVNRAIRDGLDHDGKLTAKRVDIELELAQRKREAGEAYGQERRRRLQVLRNFTTQKDG